MRNNLERRTATPNFVGTLVQCCVLLYNQFRISINKGDSADTLTHRALRARPPPKTNKTQWLLKPSGFCIGN